MIIGRCNRYYSTDHVKEIDEGVSKVFKSFPLRGSFQRGAEKGETGSLNGTQRGIIFIY